jgi:hypothetical protein
MKSWMVMNRSERRDRRMKVGSSQSEIEADAELEQKYLKSSEIIAKYPINPASITFFRG